jgi:hypothetical protein
MEGVIDTNVLYDFIEDSKFHLEVKNAGENRKNDSSYRSH